MFWNLRLKAENLQKNWDHYNNLFKQWKVRTIFSNAPKRNQSSFFIYSNSHRASVKVAYPNASFGDIAKIISKQFKALSDKERAKYDKLAAEDKIRYLKEMEVYKTG